MKPAFPTLFKTCALAAPLLLAACGGSDAASDAKLIGGDSYPDVSPQTRFPATVGIQGNCTATKIGERKFLTAAHCATSFDATLTGLDTTALNPLYLPGATMAITNAKNPDLFSWTTVTVKQTYVNPTWGNGCANKASCPFNVPSANGADVAVFYVNELTPTVPVAAVDTSPVADGAPLVVTGYGCEVGTSVPVSFLGRYKDAASEARPLAEINAKLSYKTWTGEYAWNVATPGRASDPSAASICPGDSGGPLYRNFQAPTVVGVNSYYGFVPKDSVGVSVYNFHTRLSTAAVKTWLATLP